MHVYDLLPVYNTCHKNIINVKYKANGIAIRQAAIKAKQNKNKIKTACSFQTWAVRLELFNGSSRFNGMPLIHSHYKT